MKYHSNCSSLPNSESDPPRNQDRVFADDTLGLYILCDGMGGHAAGEVAAEIATRTVREYLFEHEQTLLRCGEAGFGGPEPIELVRVAIQSACKRVFDEATVNPAWRGMGCTLTMVIVRGAVAVMGHVGDSRLYLVRQREVHQLSRDHTFVQELVDRGAMNFAQASASPYAHVLSRAVGVQESVQVDTLRFEILPDDLLLLCSDGFTDVVDGSGDIEAIVSRGPPWTVAEGLTAAARGRGSSDDISAVTVQVQSSPEAHEEEQLRSDEALLKLETLRKIYLFQGLPLQDLARIVDRCFVTSREQGAVVFREGEAGNTMCMILEGRLLVTRQGRVIAELGEGNHAGEMALLCDTPRSASVSTAVPTRLLLLSREDFLGAMQEEPVTGTRLLLTLARELSARLVAMNERLGEQQLP